MMDEERKNNMTKLRELTYELGSEISGHGNRETLNILKSVLDHAGIYGEIVTRDGKLVHVTKKASELVRKHMGKDAVIGGLCYEQLSGRTAKCESRPIHEAMDRKEVIKTKIEFAGYIFRITAIPLFDNGASAVLVIGKKLKQ